MTPVYLASGGVVCHAGRGLHALQKGLLAPASRPHYRTLTEITPAVTVPWLPATQLDEENSAMALATAAVADALVAYSPTQRRNMALFIASSSADLIGRERVYTAAVARGESALPWIRPGAGLLASRLAEQFGLGGGQYTINTACSSGVHALMYAAAAIRRGDCAHALVLGLECPGRVTLAGFNSLMLFTRSQCRPFDRERDGLILGQAAAAVVVDTDCQGPDFDRMQLLGAASACDTSSVTQTNADAARALMTTALNAAGVTRVDAIKAHGTGTPGSDGAEAAAITAYMAADYIPVTSIKPVLGHTLGACGVLETLAMAVCWQAGCLPATAGFRQPDPDAGLTPLTQVTALPPGRMLLNYFGFGGNNGVLVLEYAP